MRRKLTDLQKIEAQLHDNDVLHIVDVSDTTQDPAGSSFKVDIAQLKEKINIDQTVEWGDIEGNLDNQIDLKERLELKLNTTDFSGLFDTDFSAKTTSDLSEGTNLYFTNPRAVTALTGANNSIFTNDSGFISDLTGFSTTDLLEGTNLYYTEGRVSANTDVSANTTHRTSDGKSHSDVVLNNAYRAVGHIPLTQKASNNGVATLDAGGKIPAGQLPSTVMEFKGTWNASTNTPTLANGTGTNGDVYLTSVAGTIDLGAGNITFAEGDWVVYSGAIWEKSINSNQVVSVNEQQGVVTLDTGDIAEGTNLYYTDARAITALEPHTTNANIHREINDSATGVTNLWSASKINTELGTKANESDVVKLTGDQTVGGVKTFSDNSIFDERVGIGTTSPTAPLEINDVNTATAATALRVRGTNTGNKWSGRIVAGGPSNVFLMGQYGDYAWLGAHNAALNAWADFYINPDGAKKLFLGAYPTRSTNIMTIDNATGNVGIGTTTPTARLSVYGDSDITQQIIRGHSTQTENLQEWQNSAGSVLAQVASDGGIWASGGTATGRGLNFMGATARIQATGGTLLPSGVLRRGAGAIIEGSGGGPQVIGNLSDSAPNYTFRSDTGIGMGRPDANTLSLMSSGEHRLTVIPDGNVGIGTTTPSEKLNVAGNILATGAITGSNLSGTNTGDQTDSDFDIKDLTDSTDLRGNWNSKEDGLGNPVTNGQVLASQTDGTRSWTDLPDAEPAGADTEIQFNNGGEFGASNDLTWDNTLNELKVSGQLALSDSATATVIGDLTGNARGTYSLDVQSFRFGGDDTRVASGLLATAVGSRNSATANITTAVGYNNVASGGSSTAVGNSSNATGVNSVALGTTSNANGDDSAAIGSYNTATTFRAFAIGTSSVIGGGTQIASIGSLNRMNGGNSVMVGTELELGGDNSVLIGYKYSSNHDNQVVLGTDQNNLVVNDRGFSTNNLNPVTKSHLTGNALVTDVEQLGTELVTNGTFTGSASGWTLGTGWQYNSNRVRKNVDGTGTLSQSLSITAGKYYYLQFEMSGFSAGTFTVGLGGETSQVFKNGLSSGFQVQNTTTYSLAFNASTTGDIIFTPSNDCRIERIDNISVKEITGGDIEALGGIEVGGSASFAGGTATIDEDGNITGESVQANNHSTNQQTLTDEATIAWDIADGGIASVTLEGNRTLGNPTNVVVGAKYVLRVTQDATGGRTLAYSANFKFPAGVTPVLSASANSVDMLEFVAFASNQIYLTNFIADIQ